MPPLTSLEVQRTAVQALVSLSLVASDPIPRLFWSRCLIGRGLSYLPSKWSYISSIRSMTIKPRQEHRVLEVLP
jgi:hypothetical protein